MYKKSLDVLHRLATKMRVDRNAFHSLRTNKALARFTRSPLYASFVKASKYTSKQVESVWDKTVEVFLRLRIRAKLSLIVGVSIVGTTLVISTIATQIEQRELRLQTNTVGMTIVQGLG